MFALVSALSLAFAAAPSPAAPHRVALAQYEIEGRKTLAQVMAKVETLTASAAAGGAELMILPELFVLDVWPKTLEDEPAFVRKVAKEMTPAARARLAALSRTYGLALLAGSMPELRGGKLYNTAHLYFPDGRDVRQDKMFLTHWGETVGMVPGEKLETFDTPWGRSAILICYDVEIPQLSSTLVPLRPEVLLVPSMTESEHGFGRVRWSAQARAVEHHAYVLVVGTVGQPSPDWRHFGQGVGLTPRDKGFPGTLAAGTKNAAELVFVELDLDRLRASRERVTFYPAKDELRRRAHPSAAVAP